MIKITHHHRFKGFYEKLTSQQKKKFEEFLKLFCKNPHHKILKNHRLKGDLLDFWAFSVGGDLRVIYAWRDKNIIELYKIGSHAQVY